MYDPINDDAGLARPSEVHRTRLRAVAYGTHADPDRAGASELALGPA